MSFNACNDMLDKNPTTQAESGTIITNMLDLQNAVNGVYFIQTSHQSASLGLQGTYAGDFTIHADLLGSDFESKGSNSQISPVGKYSVDTKHTITLHYYAKFYLAIAQINDILSKLDMVQFTSGEEEVEKAKLKEYQGQLYALRGLFHFDLARLYAKLPSTVSDLTKENSGIPISDQVFPMLYKPKRATLKETYDFIINDLETALDFLDPSKTKTVGYINYWATKGILARAYLYLEQNDKALAIAKEIISQDAYTLYTTKDYLSVWKAEGTSESIFELKTTAVYNAQRNSLGYYTNMSNGYGECGLTEEFKSFLDKQEGDIRKELQFLDKDQYYPAKYPGRDGIYVNNPKIIRLSEVYLIATEAAFKLNGGSDTDALKYYNDLRRNRIEKYTDVTSITLEDILNERRLELFAEGHGAWDFWRNKLSIKNTTVGDVNYDNNKTILPFPNREIAQNPDLIQNPQ